MASKVIKIEIPIETQDKTDPAISNITAKLEDLDETAKKAQKSIDETAKKTQQSMSQASKSTSGFEKSLAKAEQSASKMSKQNYRILLEAKDKLTPTVKQALTYMKSLAGKTWSVTLKAVDLVTSPIKRVFGLLKSPLVAAGITISAGAGIADVVKTYAGFESAMSQVKAISGATAEEFTQLTAKAKQMGATTKYTAEESAEAFNYMAMAGWKAGDMISGIEGIMNLAAASGESLGSVSDIVTDALTAFNLTAKDSGHFSDVLAQAAAYSNTNVGKMGQTFQYVAPIAGAMGYSIEDTALSIGLMANAGIKGERAGTALRAIFTRLAAPPKDAADAINALGLSVTNADGSMRPLNDVMKDLRKSFSGLTQEQQVQMASSLAGQEAMSGLLALVNASEEDYNNLAEAVNNADGASKKMADTMLDNLAGKYTLFTSALDGVKLSLGERIKPYLMEALDWMTNAMPGVEDTLLRTMDTIDHFVENTKEKVAEFTSTDEWKNADLFGKIKIGWDKLISEPFGEWWDSKGKTSIMAKAKDIGTGLGSGISTGILTLLGIDVGSTIDEGATIGKQFASGFVSGFDTSKIQSALGSALSGLFKNAGKIFTGDSDLTSWLSAAVIAKVAAPLLGAGIKGAKLGKTIFGSGEGGLGLGSTIIGSAAAGTGMKGLGASAGMLGIKLGSTATTGAGLIAAGTAGVAGGLVGGASLISGGLDAYHAVKSDDSKEQEAYGTSAALKIGGVATGAAIGTMILPGLGTLIGAGIGGLAGWLGGNAVKDDYEETKQAAEEAAAAAELMEQKSKYALEGSRFETSKLKDAFNDTTVSAEQFAGMMQEATSNKIKDSFGDIKLSFQEIKDAAKQIVFGDKEKAMTTFADAASQAENSFSSLQSSISTMDKLNWKASLGMSFDEADVESYKAGIDSLISSASQYLEDKHYHAKAAIDLLVEPGNETDMFSGLNEMYAGLQEKVSSLGQDLHAKVNVALEDGVITLDEQAEITNLQNQITDITNQISQAETEASFQSLKIKYSGASLDADSFANLITEIQQNVQEAAQSYDEALQISLTNLNLQLQNGAISQEEFDAQLQALTEGYQAKIQNLSVRVESFELQSIADAFGSELDGILPDLEGTVAERLGEAMHNAMANGVDVENWDVSTATKWLGLEGLSAETQSAMTELMSQVAASLPEQMQSALEGSNVDMGESVNNMINSSIENADLSSAGNALTGKLGESMSNVDMSESGAGLQEGIQNSLTASLEGVDLSEAATGLNSKLGEAMSSVDMSESGSGIQQGLQSSVTTAIEGVDLTEAASGLNTKLSEAMSGTESVDMSAFVSALGESINGSLSGLDYSGVTTAVGTGISNAITATMGTIQGSITSLYSSVGSAINSAFAAGFSTTTTVTITVDYKLANPSATISFSGGGSGTATVSGSVASNANGSIVDGPLLSWVGEDGPEAIIPLGGKRRSRGIELWRQAGDMLGVPQFANGGIVGHPQQSITYIDENTQNALKMISDTETGTESTYYPDTEEKEAPANENGLPITTNVKTETPDRKNDINLNVQVNPQFVISGEGKNDEDILRIIKTHLKELADDLGGELAERLGEVYSNMPLKEA